MSISQVLTPIVVPVLAYVLFHALQILYRDFRSPLRHVVGPRSPSLILGNFKEMAQNPNLTTTWRKQYGPNFQFRGLFGISELHTSDIKALNHIVTNISIYQRPEVSRDAMARFMGKGLLSVELDEHKRQRRILNPAFGVTQIRILTEIFIQKSLQLRDLWLNEVAQSVSGQARVDISSWARRVTLDVIGQAGFDYDFDSLTPNGKPNELSEVLSDLFHSPRSNIYAIMWTIQSLAPILKLLPLPGASLMRHARTKMFTIGRGIVSRSKASMDTSAEGKKALSNKRDLLSMLLKANLDLPDDQRLTEEEVIAQIPTFFLAGHETTSVALQWALHALSLNNVVQTKLREELFTIDTENPTMDELNSLPYLEKVIRELMRVHSPGVFVQRKAMADDVLPLSKPYIDKEGNAHDSLPIPKGQRIHLPILAVNTSKEIWGEDADVFRPERWDNISEAVNSIPSIWANLFTFFAGPHNCIGFRFSLVEIKAMLFTLIRTFEVQPAVPKGGVGPVIVGLMQRPAVLTDVGKSSGLPLILKAVNMESM